MEEVKCGDRSATDKMSAKGDSERLSSTFSEAAAEDTTKGEASADKTD